MPPSIDIQAVVAKLDRARTDETLPEWVSLLLETVLLLVATLQEHLAAREAEIAQLRKELYGKKSERRPRKSTAMPRPPKKTAQPRLGPSALDQADLPEETVVHEVSEADRICAVCGGQDFDELPATEDSTEYTLRPVAFVRVQHQRKKYACRNGCCVVTAPGPPKVIEGGRFSSSLYADIVTKRSFDAIPFHRQADAFSRAGIPLSASTICDLFGTASKVLTPLYQALLQELRDAPVLPRIADYPAHRVAELLPHRWKPVAT